MQEDVDATLNNFKFNKLPQLPRRMVNLNLNVAIENQGEAQKTEQKEKGSKSGKRKLRDQPASRQSEENTIVFQLGSSISKKCVVSAKKTEADSLSVSRDPQPSGSTLNIKSPCEILQAPSISEIQNIRQDVFKTESEIHSIRREISQEISGMIAEMTNYKETLVDYWIELTLTQTKSTNNQSPEGDSDTETLLNYVPTK
ncbi:hypothetical protein HWI79_3362 [Cryptosporidium felis]|nr:hypothetical protein HWI79_3362 [Cryptosporidium felis]